MTTESNDEETKFRLLKLPAELRNKIYRYILLGEQPSIVPPITDRMNWGFGNMKNAVHLETVIKRLNEVLQEPGILRTCQIRGEASSIYYGENVFDTQHYGALDAFLARMDPERRKLVKAVAHIANYNFGHHIHAWEVRKIEKHLAKFGIEVAPGTIRGSINGKKSEYFTLAELQERVAKEQAGLMKGTTGLKSKA